MGTDANDVARVLRDVILELSESTRNDVVFDLECVDPAGILENAEAVDYREAGIASIGVRGNPAGAPGVGFLLMLADGEQFFVTITERTRP